MEKREERKRYEVPDMQHRLTAIGHKGLRLWDNPNEK